MVCSHFHEELFTAAQLDQTQCGVTFHAFVEPLSANFFNPLSREVYSISLYTFLMFSDGIFIV